MQDSEEFTSYTADLLCDIRISYITKKYEKLIGKEKEKISQMNDVLLKTGRSIELLKRDLDKVKNENVKEKKDLNSKIEKLELENKKYKENEKVIKKKITKLEKEVEEKDKSLEQLKEAYKETNQKAKIKQAQALYLSTKISN